MKTEYFLLTLIAALASSWDACSQATLTIQGSEKKFLIGSMIKVWTDTDTVVENRLIKGKKPVLTIAAQTGNIIHTELRGNRRFWNVQLPNSNLTSSAKRMDIEFDNIPIAQIPLEGVHGAEPQLTNVAPAILYKDINAVEQEIIMKFNNQAYVSKIEFEDKEILVMGTNNQTIDAKNPRFLIKESERAIVLKIRIQPSAKNLKFKCYYLNSDLLESSITIDPLITLAKKYTNESFKIILPRPLFEDDFNADKRITFDVSGFECDKNKLYHIEDPNPLNLSYNSSMDFKVDDTNSANITIPRDSVKADTYDVKLTCKADNSVAFSQFEILPAPVVSDLSVYGQSDLVIERVIGQEHLIKISGSRLDELPGLNVEIINEATSAIYPLEKSQKYVKDAILAELSFAHGGDLLIPPGIYRIQLTRNTEDREKLYEYNGQRITITYPRLIGNEMPRVSLQHQLIEKLPKRYSAVKDKIISPLHPIIFRIDPIKDFNTYGPQFIKFAAEFTNYKNEVTNVLVQEVGQDYLSILDRPKFINLKELFDIKRDLLPNETVTVKVVYASDIYGTTIESPGFENKYYSFVKTSDRIGLTFAIPPYLIATRRVKRKVITQEENENVNVQYSGEAETEFQPLAINAGLGLKYRLKNREYEDSRFACAAYFMGVDFANGQSKSEQVNDPENHNFIGRGSFNVLFLLEYSLFNLDNPNVRVPLYFGHAWILDPLDDGRNGALTFGLGIDIRLFGKN